MRQLHICIRPARCGVHAVRHIPDRYSLRHALCMLSIVYRWCGYQNAQARNNKPARHADASLEAPMAGRTAFMGAHTMQVTPKVVGRQWAYSYLAVGTGLSCNDITNTLLSVRPTSSTSKLHVNRQAFRMWHKGDGQGNRPPINFLVKVQQIPKSDDQFPKLHSICNGPARLTPRMGRFVEILALSQCMVIMGLTHDNK